VLYHLGEINSELEVFTTLFAPIDLLRDELSKLGPFWWMAWNAALALIPVGLAVIFLKRSEQPKRRISTPVFLGQIFLIMLFLPNAPYIATDLVHFLETVRTTDLSLWHLLATQFPLYIAFVLLGIVCYAFTTDRILFAMRRRFGRSAYRVALFAIPILSSIGIYLGRVARFNSWDILNDPLHIARSSENAFADARIFKIVFSMALLLFLVHQLYKIFHDGLRVRFERRRTRQDARIRNARKNRREGVRSVTSEGALEAQPD
jgi:uncharacterized membrane protein